MSVTSTIRRNDYTASGTLAEYDFTFKILDDDDIEVVVRDTDDVETTLVKTTDYTVSGVGDAGGGTVTLVDLSQDWMSGGFLEAGFAICIRRNVALTQPTDIRNQGEFLPETHEDALDRIVMQEQGLQDQLDRSLHLGDSVVPSDVDTEIPVPVAGSVLGWNSTADAIENISPSELVTVAASETKVVDRFDDGPGFTAGTTTTLTLTESPGNERNIAVYFDGVYQHHNTFSVSGTVITFDAAIPPQTASVEVQYGHALGTGVDDAGDVSYQAPGSGSVVTNLEDILDSMLVTPQMFGAVGNGTTDDTAALEAACNSGAKVIDLGGKTYAVDTTFDVLASNVTIIGKGAKIKATTLQSGDTAVCSVANLTNVKFLGDITFDANGYRRWGLIVNNGCSNCVIEDCDAINYTDIFGQGFKLSAFTNYRLKPTQRLEQCQYSGIAAGTAGSLATGTYIIGVVAVDAMGKEGPAYTPGNSDLDKAVTGPTGSLSITWKKVPGARSYRVYFGLLSSSDWERYYSVPVDPTDPATYTKVVTSGSARKIVDPTLSVVAGGFVDVPYRNYYLRVAPYYTDGAGNHSGNSVTNGYPNVRIDDTSHRARAAWSAPAGATPAGYLLFMSSENTGGLRDFERVIDVGNVTTYDHSDPAECYLMYPYGNSDEAVCDGYMPRNMGGGGKAILNGEIYQSTVIGHDVTHQIARQSEDTGTDPATSIPFSGHQWRLKKVADTAMRVFWSNGLWGNSDDFWFSHRYPTVQNIMRLVRGAGVLKPSQAMASAYMTAAHAIGIGGLTPDTEYTTEFDGETFDTLGNYSQSTFIFTAPVDGKYRAYAQIAFLAAAATTAAELKLRCNSQERSTYTENIALSKYNVLVGSEIFDALAGESIYCKFRCSGQAVTYYSNNTTKNTRFSVELIG